MPDESSAVAPSGTPNESLPDLEKLLAEVNALWFRLNQLGRARGLPAGAHKLLQVLEREGPQSVPEISRRRCTSRQNIQIVVNRLVAQGCVELLKNPGHRRSSLVGLTERGRSLLAQGTSQNVAVLEPLRHALGEAEVTDALEVLTKIRRLLVGLDETVAPARQLGKQKSVPVSENKERLEEPKSNPDKPMVTPARVDEGEEDFPLNLL